MILTENEAYGQFCPFRSNLREQECIAKGCMAWVEEPKYEFPDDPWVKSDESVKTGKGFCGLVHK